MSRKSPRRTNFAALSSDDTSVLRHPSLFDCGVFRGEWHFSRRPANFLETHSATLYTDTQ
jgi:hypothetical protein